MGSPEELRTGVEEVHSFFSHHLCCETVREFPYLIMNGGEMDRGSGSRWQ
jgi:hypothetical protein